MYDCICTGYTAAAGRYRCYECSYNNYDYQGDYNCVTSPWNATNGRLRECERDTAETCVTKTVYTKGTGTAVLFITSIYKLHMSNIIIHTQTLLAFVYLRNAL